MTDKAAPASETPEHVPAAFINAIADEGTKAEAIEWLQKTWNERCDFEKRLRAAEQRAERARQEAMDQVVEELVKHGHPLAAARVEYFRRALAQKERPCR